MNFISLRTDKLHKKTEAKKVKNFSAGYVGRFYSDLANDVDSAAKCNFYGRIANGVDIPSEDVQKYLLPISGFARGMQGETLCYAK